MNIQVDDIVKISIEPGRRAELARAGAMGLLILDSDGCELQVVGIKHSHHDDDGMRAFSLQRRDGVRLLCSSVDFMFLRHGRRESAVPPQVQHEKEQLSLF